MAEANIRGSPADVAEPPRTVARSVPIIDTSIEGEPDILLAELNQSWECTARPSQPNGPHPLVHNPSHAPSSVAYEQLQLRKSAKHLLMLASGAQQPAASAKQCLASNASALRPDASDVASAFSTVCAP